MSNVKTESSMKKLLTMIAMLTLSVGMMAQAKFHDVEANEATGPVKSISMTMMGNPVKIDFTKEGKMQREGLTDAVYDANGYLQSAKMERGGQQITLKLKWENGRVKSQETNVMGNTFATTYVYNEKGAVASQSMNMGGQEMSIPYSNYKYDDHGNWISRKTSMMGQEVETTRTIEYYE